MIDKLEPQIDQLMLFRPTQIRRKAQLLRERSRQCADLASNALTEEGKQVLCGMASDLGGEAAQLEDALLTIRRLYAETLENDPGEYAQG
jgi:hypothetical protein